MVNRRPWGLVFGGCVALLGCTGEIGDEPEVYDGNGNGNAYNQGSTTSTTSTTTSRTNTGNGSSSSSSSGNGGAGGTPPQGGAGGSGGTPITWQADIAVLMDNYLCSINCHVGNSPAANYNLTSYQNAFGNGDDNVPNVIPGNINSKLHFEVASGHRNMSDADVDLIRDWIGVWNAQEQ